MSSVSPCASKEATKIGGSTPALMTQWISPQSQYNGYDLRIILRLFVDSHCVIRGVGFLRMTVKRVLGGAR